MYLIHLERSVGVNTRHYIGFAAADVDERLEVHRSGNGSRLLREAVRLGIRFTIVREWPDGDRAFERKLKKRKNAWRLCPECRKVWTTDGEGKKVRRPPTCSAPSRRV